MLLVLMVWLVGGPLIDFWLKVFWPYQSEPDKPVYPLPDHVNCRCSLNNVEFIAVRDIRAGEIMTKKDVTGLDDETENKMNIIRASSLLTKKDITGLNDETEDKNTL